MRKMKSGQSGLIFALILLFTNNAIFAQREIFTRNEGAIWSFSVKEYQNLEFTPDGKYAIYNEGFGDKKSSKGKIAFLDSRTENQLRRLSVRG